MNIDTSAVTAPEAAKSVMVDEYYMLRMPGSRERQRVEVADLDTTTKNLRNRGYRMSTGGGTNSIFYFWIPGPHVGNVGYIHNPHVGTISRVTQYSRAAAPRELVLEPDRLGEPDHWDSPNVIRTHSRYIGRVVRLGLLYVGPAGQCRRVYEGPILPGPYVGTYALSWSIDNHGGTGADMARLEAAGLEFEAKPGDRFRIGGLLFELRDDRPYDYPTMVPVSEAASVL